jgi:glycosyltransferase involved in cell wall biosynthesis
LKNLPVNANKVFVLHNIVVKQQGLPERKREGGVLRLVTVSNIRRTKNIQFAIELVKVLNSLRPCSLAIIGKKAELDYYDELMALVNLHGLADKVQMTHGTDQVQPLLHNYDLAVHTAKSESGPLVLIEYLAQNLPFITYNTGETVLQVKDDLPELIADSFETDEWIGKIEALLKQDEWVARKKLAGVFDKYFSEQAYYDACVEIYEKGLMNSRHLELTANIL